MSIPFPKISEYREYKQWCYNDNLIRSEIFPVILFHRLTLAALRSEYHESRSSADIHHRSAVPHPGAVIQAQNRMSVRHGETIQRFQSDSHRIQACHLRHRHLTDAHRDRKHATRDDVILSLTGK